MREFLKRFGIIVLGFVVILGIPVGSVALVACATEKRPALADKMSREDVLEMQLLGMQLADLQRKVNDAAAPIAKRREEIMRKYDLAADDKLAADGTITRASKAADMGSPDGGHKKGK